MGQVVCWLDIYVLSWMIHGRRYPLQSLVLCTFKAGVGEEHGTTFQWWGTNVVGKWCTSSETTVETDGQGHRNVRLFLENNVWVTHILDRVIQKILSLLKKGRVYYLHSKFNFLNGFQCVDYTLVWSSTGPSVVEPDVQRKYKRTDPSRSQYRIGIQMDTPVVIICII